MKRPKMKSLASRRVGRAALVLGMSGGLLLAAAGVAEAAVGNDPGAVQLSEQTGSTNDTPTWHTTDACPAGFTGSAVFLAIFPGSGNERISPVVASVAASTGFSGTLFENIGLIQSDSGVANGGTQELAVQCWSGASTTGNSTFAQDLFITYSADGTTFSTSGSGTTVPVGEIGGPIIAGLAAIGLVGLQVRRRRSRRMQASQV